MIELTLEQKFSISKFKLEVEQMSEDQAKNFLVNLYREMLLQEATYRELIKEEWGFESPKK
jgi:hypothetical protein